MSPLLLTDGEPRDFPQKQIVQNFRDSGEIKNSLHEFVQSGPERNRTLIIITYLEKQNLMNLLNSTT